MGKNHISSNRRFSWTVRSKLYITAVLVGVLILILLAYILI